MIAALGVCRESPKAESVQKKDRHLISVQTSVYSPRVLNLRTELGERFHVLVNDNSGLPMRVAARYGFETRGRGGAARLVQRLRRVGELYRWFYNNAHRDLDDTLLSGELPQLQLLLRALQSFQEGRQDARQVTNEDDDVPRSSSSALHNSRITAWLDFISFAAIPDNWRSGQHYDDHDIYSEARARRQQYLIELRHAFNERRVALPESTSHQPLSLEEQACIDELVEPDSPHNPFAAQSRERNFLLYRTVRHLGPRIGEALKIKIQDLPKKEHFGSSALRQIKNEPRYLRIVRRPDDPDDPRLREVRVKRGDRNVAIPDDLADDLHSYAGGRSKLLTVSQYLFISTTNHTMPLSQSRAEKIIKQLGGSAHKMFQERYPHSESSLEKLCWHRLRTTRAIEALPEFFAEGVETEESTERFILYFGWKAMESARPYLRALRQASAYNHRLRIQSELRGGKT